MVAVCLARICGAIHVMVAISVCIGSLPPKPADYDQDTGHYDQTRRQLPPGQQRQLHAGAVAVRLRWQRA
jgi:hypothetical protein